LPKPEETCPMDDQDLSGDDLKYVSYAIIFTKRDYEATLEENTQELVNYPTNGGSCGGLKITKYFTRFTTAQGNERPEVWANAKYPPAKYFTDENHWEVPPEDENYITFIYKVEKRLPREHAEYDKRTVKALRGIEGKLG
jgi:hypothetical protein